MDGSANLILVLQTRFGGFAQEDVQFGGDGLWNAFTDGHIEDGRRRVGLLMEFRRWTTQSS
ncbi:MAG: hypothetical protein AAGG56_10270 [Pseudomonadota bacterium]